MARSKRVPVSGAVTLTPSQIKAWRVTSGYYQSTMALRFGVSTRTVSRWETGASYPPPPVCEAIARGLGMAVPFIRVSLAHTPRHS